MTTPDRKQKIRDLLRQNARVLTFPKTEDEAEAVQMALFEEGVVWPDGTQIVKYLEEVVQSGLLIARSNTLYLPSHASEGRGVVVPAAFFLNDGEFLTADEKIDALRREVKDLTTKVDRLLACLEPSPIDKPVLRPPAPR